MILVLLADHPCQANLLHGRIDGLIVRDVANVFIPIISIIQKIIPLSRGIVIIYAILSI